MNPTKLQIATAVRSTELAERCIRKTLKLHNGATSELLPIGRAAELEACCVILMRTKSNLWQQYEKAAE